jgi:hypothetical protein
MSQRKPPGKPPSQRERPGRRFDTRMIRDFLEFLRWELRTSRFELSRTKPGTDRPELLEQLIRYVKEYGTVLLPVIAVEPPVTPEQVAALQDRWKAIREEQLAALEFLMGGLIPVVLEIVDQTYEGKKR